MADWTSWKEESVLEINMQEVWGTQDLHIGRPRDRKEVKLGREKLILFQQMVQWSLQGSCESPPELAFP